MDERTLLVSCKMGDCNSGLLEAVLSLVVSYHISAQKQYPPADGELTSSAVLEHCCLQLSHGIRYHVCKMDYPFGKN